MPIEEQVVELRPCPFCGGEAYTFKRGGERNWVAGCKAIWPDCPVAPFTHPFDTEAEAIAAWNTRPDTLPVADEGYVEAVARALCKANFEAKGSEGEFGGVDDCWWAFAEQARIVASVPRPEHLVVRDEVLEAILNVRGANAGNLSREGVAWEAYDQAVRDCHEAIRALGVVEIEGADG